MSEYQNTINTMRAMAAADEGDRITSSDLNECDTAAAIIEDLEEEIAILEGHIELLWRETDGILPSTGRMWLTPRMEREKIKAQQEGDG
jgi:hypothetical protein